jgi:hypothetical protein
MFYFSCSNLESLSKFIAKSGENSLCEIFLVRSDKIHFSVTMGVYFLQKNYQLDKMMQIFFALKNIFKPR